MFATTTSGICSRKRLSIRALIGVLLVSGSLAVCINESSAAQTPNNQAHPLPSTPAGPANGSQSVSKSVKVQLKKVQSAINRMPPVINITKPRTPRIIPPHQVFATVQLTNLTERPVIIQIVSASAQIGSSTLSEKTSLEPYGLDVDKSNPLQFTLPPRSEKSAKVIVQGPLKGVVGKGDPIAMSVSLRSGTDSIISVTAQGQMEEVW